LNSPCERFSRTIDLVGAPGFEALRRARVAVFGLGGVGSHAAVALARSGIGALRLVDHDKVQASNLNRHAVATPADIGKLKTSVMERYLLGAAPDTSVEVIDMVCGPDNLDQALGGSLDFVVDCIDGLNAKVSLLANCVKRGLAVVSSMGASSRTDPLLLRIGDIEKSEVCPLAKFVRKRLRRQGIQGGVIAVYSVEKKGPVLPADLCDEQGDLCRARSRLPSLSTMPGIFGYAAANVVIARLSGLSRRQGDDEPCPR
jgi:tRNA A37 threonylcarbamoyladenosine dehydratase